MDELADRSVGFHDEGLLARLRQVAGLLEHREQAGTALAQAIRGDHQEYLLKIERLLDRLADDQWLVREEAERALIEDGARGIERIEARRRDGETLEERLRCDRVLKGILARGMEKEQAEARLLEGYLVAASFWPPSPRLARALETVLGHPDHFKVRLALDALGSVGDEQSAEAVYRLLDGTGGTWRAPVAAALCRMPTPRALELLRELVFADRLSTEEAVAVVRDLRLRGADAAPLLRAIADYKDPVVGAAAALDVPTGLGDAEMATLELADGELLRRPFLGIRSDAIVIRDPVVGLESAPISTRECNTVVFEHDPRPAPAGVRVFLVQGTRISGELVGLTESAATLDNRMFGRVDIPRGAIQGIAADPEVDRLIGASRDGDIVRLRDDTAVEGRLREFADGRVTIVLADGSERAIALTEIAGLLFQRVAEPAADPGSYTRLDLVDGDRLLMHLAASNRAQFGGVVPGLGSAIVPVAEVMRVALGIGGGAMWGFTVIADYGSDEVIEIDDRNRRVFGLTELYGPRDVECLVNGNLLVTEFALSTVRELTRTGEEVWIFEDLKNPCDADRLPNGNTLIADSQGERVIEVSPSKEIVWQFADDIPQPLDVDRLPNGNTLIADGRKERVIEVTPAGEVVWSLDNLPGVHDADRLPNGNTLITLRVLYRVIEVTHDGREVFRIGDLMAPTDADRLPNGNTLVAEQGRISEYDRNGRRVWEREIAWAMEVNRY